MTVHRVPTAFRVLIHAYPRTFRDEYGADMAQLFADRQREHGHPAGRLLAAEAVDCLRTAPRLHLEKPMTRIAFPYVLVIVAALGFALLGGGLLPAVILSVLLLAYRRQRPIADAHHPRWWTWFVAAGIAVAVLFTVLAIDGDELTTVGRSIAFLSGNGAIVLTLIGVGTGLAHLVRTSRSAPAA
ncbi:MAG TPA: hypothetical protein VID94_14620 [Acidimicrobiales bacterium]